MTSNIDIQNELQNYKQFKGVYSKDTLDDNLQYGFYIINLDISTNKGTHWVAYYRNKIMNVYFDSFGMPPLDILNIKPIVMNSEQIQNENSIMCGQYCIAFIKFMNNKKNIIDSFQTFINLFKSEDNNIKNDEILKKLLITLAGVR